MKKTKIVTIPIQVEVPEDTKQVAVDSDGLVWATKHGSLYYTDDVDGGVWISVDGRIMRCNVYNWRETLTEVK